MNTLGNVHVIPVIAPYDSATTVTEAYTDAINVGRVTECQFVLQFGTITGDTVVVKAYKDTNSTAGDGTAIPFLYKKTSAVGTDTTTAWTAATTSGVTVSASDDNKALVIDIDPARCEGAPYVYLGIDPGSSMTVLLQSAVALVVPRDNQAIPASMVA